MSENDSECSGHAPRTEWRHDPWRIPLAIRLLGLLPLTFFVLHSYRNWSAGNPGYILWMCHVSNVVLGLGLLSGSPFLIRLAIIWQVPAIPLWIMDMYQTGEAPLITFFSHLGGPAIGLVALRTIGMSRHMWPYAIIWYLLIQQLSRMFTPPALNVNVAHTMYPGWERVYAYYWQYWLFTTLGAALMLWMTEWVLLRFAPPRPNEHPEMPQADAGD